MSFSCWYIHLLLVHRGEPDWQGVYLEGGCGNDCHDRVSCVIADAANQQADLRIAGLSDAHTH